MESASPAFVVAAKDSPRPPIQQFLKKFPHIQILNETYGDKMARFLHNEQHLRWLFWIIYILNSYNHFFYSYNAFVEEPEFGDFLIKKDHFKDEEKTAETIRPSLTRKISPQKTPNAPTILAEDTFADDKSPDKSLPTSSQSLGSKMKRSTFSSKFYVQI